MAKRSACSRCGDEVTGRPWWAWAAIVAAWIPILLFGAALAILIPVNLILIPCWLAVGSSVGPLARALLDAPCPGCGAHAERPKRQPARNFAVVNGAAATRGVAPARAFGGHP